MVDLDIAQICMYASYEAGKVELVKGPLTFKEVVFLPIVNMKYSILGTYRGLCWGGMFHAVFTNTGRRYDANNHGDWF